MTTHYTISDSVSCRHEKLSDTVWMATSRNWNKSFKHIEHRTDWPRGIGEHNTSPHSWILTSVSVDSSPRSYPFTSATVRVSVYPATKSGRYLSDKWRSTFTNGTAQLRSITKTVPKSPSLCYSFRRRMSCPVGCEHSLRIGVCHWGWGKKKGLKKRPQTDLCREYSLIPFGQVWCLPPQHCTSAIVWNFLEITWRLGWFWKKRHKKKKLFIISS